MSNMKRVRDIVSRMMVDEKKVINLKVIGIEALIFRMCLSKISKKNDLLYWTKYNRDTCELTILRVQ